MQYVPFASDIEIPFYASLASHKINHDKLDDSARKVLGLYEIRPSDAKEWSCRIQVHGNALTSDDVPANYYRAEGIIKNLNTIEEYRNIDKLQLIQQAGRTIWDAISDGTIYSCPSLLASFLILSYADLKKYKFHYWFAFPAIVQDSSWVPVDGSAASAPDSKLPFTKLNSIESTTLVDAVSTWKYGVDARQHGFFLARKDRNPLFSNPVDEEFGPTTPQSPLTPTENLGYTWSVGSLSSYETGFFEGVNPEDRYVCFVDPSNYNDPAAPGWMLRNLLVLIRQRWKLDKVQILAYRETQMRRDSARSIIFNLQVSDKKGKDGTSTTTATTAQSAGPPTQSTEPTITASKTLPKIVGWERNSAGKLLGRLADLTEYMDPKKLADSSVDLNLKLMKWRISPNLNLEKIKDTKCLLLGAGTLGSYVSRNLMGWGVRKITFIDNGSVSFSNPVRQPLFNFEDCLGGGKKKAIAAAEALKLIYPGVEAEGHVLSVPMAGHPVTDIEKTKAEYEKLKQLIDEHDAIFLLMDTRESRWLPTVMGKSAGKIVMNAALGFDTYVVMRHGVKLDSPASPTDQAQSQSQSQTGLGCYFCNDVVAPADSMRDQTLDQQCTVTRPGIAAIASALLVELLVSVIQHPAGAAAPASTSTSTTSPTSPSSNDDTTTVDQHPLGIVPHQIRGFLHTFSNLNVVGRNYDCCSACSDKIVGAYEERGWEFILKALNERDYVEELSGLKEVQRLAEEAAKDIEFTDDEDEIEEEGEGELI